MYHIKILSVGKTKEAWLQSAIDEYIKRLRAVATLTSINAKDDAQLMTYVAKEPSVIPLDPQGRFYTSEQFSKELVQQLERGGSHLTFVIGGADGIPQALKENRQLMSFSPLTFTHQMTRLILVEQIYRGLEIARGSSYHRA